MLLRVGLSVQCLRPSLAQFLPKQTPITKLSYRPLCISSSSSISTLVSNSSKHSTSTFNGSLEPYLSCCMPHKRLKLAVLLSGGVDSSVALRLLHAAGHHCTAFYLKIWFQEDFENFWSECPWEEDLKYAKAVCDQVDVPLEVVHLTDEYWNNVVSYIIKEYRCGRTPNPDVLCNTRIKFGAFMDAVSSMEFDYVASGHYANIIHSSSDEKDKPSVLELSKDMVKDQTYFLSHLLQAQIKRLIFPLGRIPKDEVRELAKRFDLPNKDRKDSQGICFLGKIKFSEFVARQIGEMEGIILEAETGDFLGKHKGFWFYTIGQRQGLRLPGGPWYVVEKDVKNNVVFVSRNYFSFDKRRRLFRVGSMRWLGGLPPENFSHLRCKVRHGPGFYDCSLTMEHHDDGRGDVAVVHLSKDDQGIAAGQFAAFYQGQTCIGSGVILESWDDQGFPVCARALEIARMEDKSKLGKPVKIYFKPETPSSDSDCKDSSKVDRGLTSSQVSAMNRSVSC
ncbi:mitochondrial tRNA-specific 2-thiouridylase 1 [Tripterygium wilfordii]|uniref:tRNA-5-taurinomethyluridine 2-sulfurtransferase n=2 Tax=Tripterygium wilfordii TaxID=458696 RepID=A0A7J7CNX9_TRIWF|nr:mitochondrial tRNA-specific 2-thiouridylase 1 [Tripterygium wilfordii]